jgi:PhnB protein
MTGTEKGTPEGAPVVIPRLFCRDVAAAIEFYARTFEAVEGVRRPGPDGAVAHALLTIGPAMLMIESEWPGVANRAPEPNGSSPVALYVYVADVDATLKRAEAAGAKVLDGLKDQFWGDRTAWIMDPAGHVWTIATRIEETTEQQRRDRLSRLQSRADSGTE